MKSLKNICWFVYWFRPLLYLSEPETPVSRSGVFLFFLLLKIEKFFMRRDLKPAYSAPCPNPLKTSVTGDKFRFAELNAAEGLW